MQATSAPKSWRCITSGIVRHRERSNRDSHNTDEIEEIHPRRHLRPTVRVVGADNQPIERPVVIEKDSRSQNQTRYSKERSYDFPPPLPPGIPSRERLRPSSPPVVRSSNFRAPHTPHAPHAFETQTLCQITPSTARAIAKIYSHPQQRFLRDVL
jgi:hypothetical protein